MAKALSVWEWADLVVQAGVTSARDRLVGVSITLAAHLLDVSRSRVHQLVRAKKLAIVDVFGEHRARIGHMVTLASIAHRRRTVKPRRTQWRSETREYIARE